MKCPTCGQTPKVVRGTECNDGHEKGLAQGRIQGEKKAQEKLAEEAWALQMKTRDIDALLAKEREAGYESGQRHAREEWSAWLDKALEHAPDADEREGDPPESSP